MFDQDGELHTTTFFDQLLAELKAFGARLTVLDGRSDIFRGNQNDEHQARTFVRKVTDRIAEETEGYVVMIFQPSRAGRVDGTGESGSVQWDAAFRMVLAGLAIAEPAHALITLSASSGGGPIGACSGTDGGTGMISKICSNPNFANINVTAVGRPLVPSPNLFTTTLSVTSGALVTSDTLTIDVAQTGLSFPGGELSVSLTVVSIAGPVTLIALGPGGVIVFSQTFTTPGTVTSATIPVGPVTGDGARFMLTFTGPRQSVNASISIDGIPATTLTDPAGLADTAEPGAVLVFPKFAQGLITLNNGSVEPNTQIEIAAVCPAPAISAAGASPTECTRNNYELVVHWVCPGGHCRPKPQRLP